MINKVTPLPENLGKKIQGMALANEALVYAHQYEPAFEGFKAMYTLLVQSQPTKGRYHKGYPLHQMGITRLQAGKPEQALSYFLLAYVEDLLSQKEGQEDKADDMPASKNLRGVYKVQQNALSELKTLVRKKKQKNQLVHDPHDILNEIAEGQPVQNVAKPQEQRPDIGSETREPGKYESDWEKRVFIGGNYSTHLSEINTIKKVCINNGYDPVIADQFKTPVGLVHHHALMLLHECSKAIFEVSNEAGQLIEVERLRDYEIKPLIVCQKNAYFSKMLEELIKLEKYKFHRYSTDEELTRLVEDYLSQPLT
jgi:hypothetical protein